MILAIFLIAGCSQQPTSNSSNFLLNFNENTYLVSITQTNYSNNIATTTQYTDLKYYPEKLTEYYPIFINIYDNTSKSGRRFICYTMNDTIKSVMAVFGSKLPTIVSITNEIPCDDFDIRHDAILSKEELFFNVQNKNEEAIMVWESLGYTLLKYFDSSGNGKCFIAALNDTGLRTALIDINSLVNSCKSSAINCRNESNNFVECKDT